MEDKVKEIIIITVTLGFACVFIILGVIIYKCVTAKPEKTVQKVPEPTLLNDPEPPVPTSLNDPQLDERQEFTDIEI